MIFEVLGAVAHLLWDPVMYAIARVTVPAVTLGKARVQRHKEDITFDGDAISARDAKGVIVIEKVTATLLFGCIVGATGLITIITFFLFTMHS